MGVLVPWVCWHRGCVGAVGVLVLCGCVGAVGLLVLWVSAGSILDISKYRDTCERSISILGGIAILRYIEYRMNQ